MSHSGTATLAPREKQKSYNVNNMKPSELPFG
jgi:hypothetical protein